MEPTGTFTRLSARVLAAVAVAALLAFDACGSSDDDSGAAEGGDGSSSAPNDDADSNDDAPTPDSSGGDGTATLTMADGTVYEFETTSCDTFDTDPATIPLDGGYDLAGATSDGEFRFTLARLGFEDEVAVAVGTLEGDFDEGGQNEQILYQASRESLDALTIDGGNVSGSVEFSEVIPGGPHGTDTTATVEASC